MKKEYIFPCVLIEYIAAADQLAEAMKDTAYTTDDLANASKRIIDCCKNIFDRSKNRKRKRR